MAKFSYLFYAINGTGAGHISRCVNIAREVELLSHAIKLKADIRIMTSSDADQISPFPTYKLPSKTVIQTSDANNTDYITNSALFVMNLVGSFRPNVLVVDTIPQGSFDEFLMMRTQCGTSAFINRHKNEETAAMVSNQAAMSLYNLIITPDGEDQQSRYVFDSKNLAKNKYVGRVHGFLPETALSREEVREYFGVSENEKLVYISTGGGGDKTTDSNLEILINTLRDVPNLRLLIGFGPLHKGKKIYASNIVPLVETNVSKYFGGLDMAFSAAGYNTFEELLASKTPTAFYPLAKGMDLQDERILLASQEDLCHYIEELTAEKIQYALEVLTDPNKVKKIQDALENRSFETGAVRAAFHLIQTQIRKLDSSKLQSDLRIALWLRETMLRNSESIAMNFETFEVFAKRFIDALNKLLSAQELEQVIDDLTCFSSSDVLLDQLHTILAD
jgi:UDP-N-acetylglucosamine--N-acetylmuramyl-(pentapeptide) pyrophosphoryl-undecaprenol N-acetylglucosamine transferase